MCIVIDTNAMPSVFNSNCTNHKEFAPVRSWIINGRGHLVFGGTKYKKEICQMGRYRRIIIDRFIVGHTHWLEIDRSALGVTVDVTGGFQMWGKTVSTRESGLVFYIIDEDGEFTVNKVSGLKKQIEEEKSQGLNNKNLRTVANLLEDGIQHEIDIGLLKEPTDGLEIR